MYFFQQTRTLFEQKTLITILIHNQHSTIGVAAALLADAEMPVKVLEENERRSENPTLIARSIPLHEGHRKTRSPEKTFTHATLREHENFQNNSRNLPHRDDCA